MTGEIAALLAAAALLILVGVLAYPIIKLGRVLDEARTLLKGVADESVPLIGELKTTVTSTNDQLAKVDVITDHASSVTSNAAALASLFAATVGGPLVKVAAFSYGVRKALTDSERRDVAKRVRSDLRAQHKAERQTRRRRYDEPESVL